jgi:putative molybdopterin biosynthesis protein
MLQAQPVVQHSAGYVGRRLRFAGSHDLTVELLAHRLAESDPAYRLDLSFVGSLGGLIALARAEADVAGVHLWDATEDAYNLPFIRRVLPNRRLALVTLVRRKLGFIVPPGNPQAIHTVAELTRPGVRWFNRQPGSGTRIWLDEQLRLAGIDGGRIAGYADEGETHLAVAQAVQSGPATVGLGIQAAALAYGLDFVPLTEELYQLVISEAVWDSTAWQAALEIIRSRPFSAAVNHLGGYNTGATGEVVWT